MKIALVLLGVLGLGLVACVDHDLKQPNLCNCTSSALSIPQSADRAVDLLFVIDNSGSMADEQAMLREQFTALIQALRNMSGGLPDVHLGVTSTDLGAGDQGILHCGGVGDAGRLQVGACANSTGAPYIVDVAPRGCDIERDGRGSCTAHQCDASHCAQEPGLTFVVDDVTGCPRCRNYVGESLEDVFACVTDQGTEGCGFEQPLEAMRVALDEHPDNAGFLRDDALLTVVFLTDEDDCSVADAALYSTDATDLGSPYGPLTSFRCFEFGVTCDDDDRLSLGQRMGCVPREDPAALLHPITRYVDFLRGLKDPQLLVVSAIAGPVDALRSATVERDEDDRPQVRFSCSTARGGAGPGLRLKTLVEAFHDDAEQQWAYSSICSSTFTDALEGIGRRVTDILEYACLPSPLKGCADPGAAFGAPRDTCPDNDACEATCMVLDVLARGTPEEDRNDVHPCLEICPEGRCRGNTDPAWAYQQGHPAFRDPALPVEACWHITHDDQCPQSNGGSLTIARRADPPPRSFAYVSCQSISQTEELCNDGVDNDEDCLVDLDDPDCSF